MIPAHFRAFVVRREASAAPTAQTETLLITDLPQGELLVQTYYSSANYKDALSYSGHRGVTSRYPHVPGIDAVGVVRHSDSDEFAVGQRVIVTGYDLGMNHWGGFAEYLRVPAAWAVPLPEGLSPRRSMQLGTAGLTAAQSVLALVEHGVPPRSGPVLVTGASGGVAVVAIRLLAALGFEVIACTRKAELTDSLLEIGARGVIAPSQLPTGEGPLSRERWAAVIDTVGGPGLEMLIKSSRYLGVVTTCGMAAGDRFASSVFPFILRGVSLVGIDSARMPNAKRRTLWQKLATDWQVDLSSCSDEVGLEGLPRCLESLLAARHFGRTLVRIGDEE